MNSGSFKKCYQKTICLQIISNIYIYKQDLALNKPHGLICLKIQPIS